MRVETWPAFACTSLATNRDDMSLVCRIPPTQTSHLWLGSSLCAVRTAPAGRLERDVGGGLLCAVVWHT